MSRTTRTILGLAAVGAAGVIAGVLIAPEKGEKVRRQIKDSVCDLGDKVNSFLADAKDRGRDVVSDLKDKGKDVVSDLKDKAADLKNDIENKANAAKKA